MNVDEKHLKRIWMDFPRDSDGSYSACPICSKKSCDHTAHERDDMKYWAETSDGDIINENNPKLVDILKIMIGSVESRRDEL